MIGVIDAIIVFRILRMLVTPWEKQEAFKLGIVDKTGTPHKKYKDLTLVKERENYTLLHRMVYKFKRVIEKVPIENKNFVSFAAAVAMLKEDELQELELLVDEDFSDFNDEETLNEMFEFLGINEEMTTGPTNVGGSFPDEEGIAKVDKPLRKKKMIKRRKPA